MGLKTARSTRLLVVVVLLGVFSAVGVAAAKDDPQPPSISSAPASATNQTSASFTYTDAQTVTKFQCSLDGSAFADCGTSRPSTKSYSGLSAGSHTFRVRAVIGSTTTAATAYSWTVDQTPPPTPAVLGPL
ncbi:MAG: OmpA protein, partial [Nocardioides sp.]|nr:OmpA protein [Nocardioides sp.]